MWVCRVVCQWCPGQWGQGSWLEWPPSGQGQPAGQEASYWPPQGAPPSLGWFDVPQASGCWGPVGELGMRIGKQETVSTGCNAVTLWCHNTLGDFLKQWKPFSIQPRGFLCCSTHNGENQAWHIVLCATPSTISSESSRKNSLSGGLLGRLSVFNSCWILVDTLLLTGTPGQTPRAAAVTNTCKQWHADTHTCKFIQTWISTLTHALSLTQAVTYALAESGTESAAGKIWKGNLHTRRHRVDNSFRKIL